MSVWVNFSEIKAQTRLADILRWYGVDWLRQSGGPGQYRGRCPVHGGEGADAFHANLERGLFHCFACGAGGNVLDFVMAIERCSIREAAVRLQSRAATQCSCSGPADTRRHREPERKLVTKKREFNPPLRFRLAADSAHSYLACRGIDAETAAEFGVGWYSGPGLMANRIVIPIHDAQGRLVAYGGRALDASGPRYLFPAGFQKSQVLFNFHRAAAKGLDMVIVVEGFFDCMRVHQAGYPSVVALMGAILSAQQEHLLGHFRRIILMLDGDPTGRAATLRIGTELGSVTEVVQVSLPPGLQPDQLSPAEVQEILNGRRIGKEVL